MLDMAYKSGSPKWVRETAELLMETVCMLDKVYKLVRVYVLVKLVIAVLHLEANLYQLVRLAL